MAKSPAKNRHRYVAKYYPHLRWRQTVCNPSWIMAYLDAAGLARASGKRQPVKGFGGWHVGQPDADLD